MYCSKCGAAQGEGAAFCSACGVPLGATAAGSATMAIPTEVAVRTQATPVPPQVIFSPAPPVPAVSTGVAYAGFWLRFVALLIDSAVLWIVYLPMLAITGVGAGLLGALVSAGQSGDPSELFSAMFSGGLLALFSLFFLVRWAYYTLMESSTWQATLGKKALGLYVTDSNGQRMTFGRAAGRNLGKFISDFIPLAIGYIMAGFTARKQALHDLIAGCLVLRKI
jgi:uncharacterized RDD family membrane protein YckC